MRCCTMAANASSICASVVALKTLASWPNVFAAAGTSIPSNLLGGFSGFVSTANIVVLGTRSRNNSSRFAARGGREEGDTCDVATRPAEAADQPRRDRITADREHDRDRRGRRLCRQSRWRAANGRDHGHLTTHQIGRHCRQALELPLCPSVFESNVAAFDVACFVQALVKRSHDERRIPLG